MKSLDSLRFFSSVYIHINIYPGYKHAQLNRFIQIWITSQMARII